MFIRIPSLNTVFTKELPLGFPTDAPGIKPYVAFVLLYQIFNGELHCIGVAFNSPMYLHAHVYATD